MLINFIKEFIDLILLENPEYKDKEENLVKNILAPLNFDISDIINFLIDESKLKHLLWTEKEDNVILRNGDLSELIKIKTLERVEQRKIFLSEERISSKG